MQEVLGKQCASVTLGPDELLALWKKYSLGGTPAKLYYNKIPALLREIQRSPDREAITQLVSEMGTYDGFFTQVCFIRNDSR